MPSYRFCRPDDIPYLVQAINECYNVHFPELPELTVEIFREEMKILNLWPSNSMVAKDGDNPIAVMIGTKRADEVLILRVGARPDAMRDGHGSHLLTSLSQKLAVLGPPRLIAEVPTALAGRADFFRSVGYEYELAYTDYLWRPTSLETVPEGLVIPVTVQDLLDNDALIVSDGVAWQRARETLINGKEELRALAIASPDRIEAFLIYPDTQGGIFQNPIFQDVLAMGCQDSGRQTLFLGLLLRHLAFATRLPIRLPRLAAFEVERWRVEEMGFEAGPTWERFAAVAAPG